MLKAIPIALLSLLYPQRCKLCSALAETTGDGPICNSCWQKCRLFSGFETVCEKCGAFLSEAEPLYETFCRRCDDHHFDRARAVGVYSGAVASAVLHLKSEPFIPPRLRRQLLVAYNDTFRGVSTLIVPVPLSARRHHERGFNQAAVIARELSRVSGLPLDEHSLVRTRHTPTHRVAMDRKARELSVKNAFSVLRPKLIEDNKILLVDDILTSGATLSNCAKALKKHGAARVDALTLARAVISNDVR
jgi:ComF family protein